MTNQNWYADQIIALNNQQIAAEFEAIEEYQAKRESEGQPDAEYEQREERRRMLLSIAKQRNIWL